VTPDSSQEPENVNRLSQIESSEKVQKTVSLIDAKPIDSNS